MARVLTQNVSMKNSITIVQTKKILDLGELESVSGGSDRSWTKDGCAATCEYDSWCGSNDACVFFDVVYCNFWCTCPDGHEHEFVGETLQRRCRRCGCPNDILVG